MACLKLQASTLKQCLLNEAGHPGDCVFTMLKPEVAAAEDKRKARDHQLVRRNLADGYVKSMLSGPPIPSELIGSFSVVDTALSLADDLIAKTGGHSP